MTHMNKHIFFNFRYSKFAPTSETMTPDEATEYMLRKHFVHIINGVKHVFLL